MRWSAAPKEKARIPEDEAFVIGSVDGLGDPYELGTSQRPGLTSPVIASGPPSLEVSRGFGCLRCLAVASTLPGVRDGPIRLGQAVQYSARLKQSDACSLQDQDRDQDQRPDEDEDDPGERGRGRRLIYGSCVTALALFEDDVGGWVEQCSALSRRSLSRLCKSASPGRASAKGPASTQLGGPSGDPSLPVFARREKRLRPVAAPLPRGHGWIGLISAGQRRSGRVSFGLDRT